MEPPAGVQFEMTLGVAAFAIGDRAQFADTEKKAGIHNGNAGTITAVDAGASAAGPRAARRAILQ